MTQDEFKKLCETKLKECDDINNAPFGMNHEESTTYLQGKSSVLQWVIEMMPFEGEEEPYTNPLAPEKANPWNNVGGRK